MIMPFHELDQEEQQLLQEAEKVMANSYDPVDHFYVGAALLTTKKNIFVGTNVNTIAYAGLCAERVAIGAMIAAGERDFTKIAVICKSRYYDVTKLSGPCGICRQLISEFADFIERDIMVISSDTRKEKIFRLPISILHPYGFGPRLCGITSE